MNFKNGNVFVDGKFKKIDFSTKNGIFSAITENLSAENSTETSLEDNYVLPGFFDIHTHGCLGYDFSFCTEKEIEKAKSYYLKHGVTSILATIMTESEQTLTKACKNIANSDNQFIRGINLEGPFFKSEKKGAHNESFLTAPDLNFLNRLNEASRGKIKLVSVDPDFENSDDFIKNASKKYIISLGHSNCNYSTAKNAKLCGANHITHLFNAMRQFSHREPGIIGLASENDVYSELICDFIHIHPSVIKLMFKACPQNLVLISDSISPAGAADGVYQSGGMNVYVKNGKAVLENNTIAGSTITVFDAFKNLISIGISPETAILSATTIPAESVGLQDKVGQIEVGRNADFIVTDKDFNIIKVYKNGKAVD